jgi:enediyne biosynthesis protein E5
MSQETQTPGLSATSVATPSAPAVAAKRAKLEIDPRFIAPIFITLILIVGNFSFGMLESFPKTLLAVVTAILIEIVLGKLITGKIPHLASAYITGISVGILIRSPEWWPYALCSAISITSKYVIRVKGRHIWNPSNFGISVMLLIAASSVATLSIQWGNHLLPVLVIWALGAFIIYRLKRFHICAVYIGSFIVYTFARSAISGQYWVTELAPITGPMYQLFIFFMITDPKTTVSTKKGQMITAFMVATVEFLLRLTGGYFAIHAPYYALFLVGPTANLIEIWKMSRKPVGSKEEAIPPAA